MKIVVFAAAVCAIASVAPVYAGFDEIISFSEPGVIPGAPVDGVSIKNVTFGFSFGNNARGIDTARFGFGPSPDNIGIEGPTFGRLEFLFHQPVSAFGFQFSLLAFGFISNAASVGYLDTDGNVNKIIFDADSGAPRGDDGTPVAFSSGFANINSTVPIVLGFVDFAQNTEGGFFNRGGDPIDRFFIDNLGYDFAPHTIPLPTPAFLGAAGLAGLASLRRRRTL